MARIVRFHEYGDASVLINKIDLAPLVGANLGVMEADTLRMRA